MMLAAILSLLFGSALPTIDTTAEPRICCVLHYDDVWGSTTVVIGAGAYRGDDVMLLVSQAASPEKGYGIEVNPSDHPENLTKYLR